MPSSPRDNVDKGWAWVVMLAAFVDLTCCGLAYCNGLFHLVFSEQFGHSAALTAWCSGLPNALLNAAGPLAGVLIEYLGARATVLLGALLTFTGFFLCSFATTFWHVFLTYGVMSGLGFALCYTPAIVITGHYFRRYRNLAYGVVTTGMGVGTMLFAPLLVILEERYTWRGLMLLIAASMAHLCICAALMRPPPATSDEQTNITVEIKCCDNEDTQAGTKNYPQTQNYEYPNQKVYDSSASKEEEFFQRQSNGVGQVTRTATNHIYRPSSLVRVNDDNKGHILDSNISLPLINKLRARHNTLSSQNSIHSNGSMIVLATSMLNIQTNQELSIQNNRNNSSADCEKKPSSCDIQENVNETLWTKPFLTYLISMFLVSVGLSTTYLHFPAFVSHQSPERASRVIPVLLLIMGVGSIVGRLTVGTLTNIYPAKTVQAYSLSCVLSGLLVLALPIMCTTFAGQVLFSALFSFIGNWYSTLMGPVCIHVVHLKHLNIGFGFVLLAAGLGFLCGPPIAGLLFDVTSTYAYSFIFAGVAFVCGGAFMDAVRLASRVCIGS